MTAWSDANGGNPWQIAAAAGASNIDPQSAVAVGNAAAAGGGGIMESVGMSQGMAQYGAMMRTATALGQMSGAQQQALWGRYSPDAQTMLKQVGYQPPKDIAQAAGPHAGGIAGFLDDVQHGVAHYIGHDVLAVGAHDVGHIATDALNALGSPLRAVQHVIRAGDALNAIGLQRGGVSLEQQYHSSGVGSGSDIGHELGALFSPSAWAQAWRQTDVGEHNFDAPTLAHVQDTLDPLRFQVAKALASVPKGSDNTAAVDQLVQSFPTAQRPQVLQLATQDGQVQHAVQTLQLAKKSLGTVVLGTGFMENHPALGSKISGALDLVGDTTLDPTLIGGKALKAVELAKWGITEARAAQYALHDTNGMRAMIEDVAQRPAYQRWENQVLDTIHNQGYAALAQKFRILGEHGAATLAANNVTDAEGLRSVLSDANGLRNVLLTGGAARMVSQVPMIPHLSVLGAGRLAVAGKINSWVDHTLDSGKNIANLAEKVTGQASDEASATAKTLGADTAKAVPGDVPLARGDLTGSTAEKIAADKAGTLPTTVEEAAGASSKYAQALHDATAQAVRGGKEALPRVIRQMTRYTARKGYVSLRPEHLNESAAELNRVLKTSMTTHDANMVTDLFTKADDPGLRYRIAKAGVAQMVEAAGVPAIGGNAMRDRAMQLIEKVHHPEMYALDDQDALGGVRSAITEDQLAHRIWVPRFADVRAAVKTQGFLAQHGMPVHDWLDRGMKVWRAGVLYRTGTFVRMSLDEGADAVLRDGVKGYLASRLTRRMARAGAGADIRAAQRTYDSAYAAHQTALAATEGSKSAAKIKAAEDAKGAYDQAKFALDAAKGRVVDTGYHQGIVAKTLDTLASHVPDEVMEHVQSASDLAGAVYGHAAYRAYKTLEPGITRDFWMNSAKTYYDYVYKDHLAEDISAVHNHAGGTYDEASQIQKMLSEGTHGKPIRFKMGGPWKEATPSDPTWRLKYHAALSGMAQSKLAQSVLSDISKSKETQIRNVVKLIESPEFANERAMFARAHAMSDGRTLADGVTQDQIHRDWARKVVGRVNGLVRSAGEGRKQGPVLQDLVNEMIETGHPSMETLDAIPHTALPAKVYGPDMVAVHKIESVIAAGWDKFGRIVNMQARDPAALHSFTKGLARTQPYAEALMGKGKPADELAAHMAADLTRNEIKDYIHSPEIRTQFEAIHRVAMPFLFAQHQFLQRWGRLALTNPAAMRKIQLTTNGLRASGIIHRDQNGNDYFYYPGSQYVTKYLSSVLSAIGIHASLPIEVPFTGQMKYIVPGINDPITPSVGPTVAIPMKELATMFPELQGPENTMLGQGSGGGFLQQIAPVTLTRLVTAMTGTPNSKGEFASAAMQAIQLAGAHGIEPPVGSQPGDPAWQNYMNTINNWTRTLMFTKAVLGFGLPSTPSAHFDVNGLSAEFTKYLGSGVDYNTAISQFLAAYGEKATPYTIAKSTSQGGGTMPATAAAGGFLNANKEFAGEYPRAMGWFVPRTVGTGPFNNAVYQQQMLEGLRVEKTPEQFLEDVNNAPAASTYYNVYDQVQQSLQQYAHDPGMKTQINQEYDQWKQLFLSVNPNFAATLTSSAAKVRREQTVRELENALSSPLLPQGPQTDHVRSLVQGFAEYMNNYAALSGKSGSAYTAQRTSMKAQFETAATAYAAANPDVSDLWNLVLRPEVSDTMAGLVGNYGSAVLLGAA